MSFAQSATSAIDLTNSLAAGIEEVSDPKQIPFVQYIRYVLPLDGYVFWLRVQQTTFTGSVHYARVINQAEGETLSVNRVVFTTTQEIQPFTTIDPQTLWIGDFGDMRFAFSSRGFFSPNAKVYHYEGDAVYSYMESQLVDVGAQLPLDTLVVSNSLPAWLAVKTYSPIWLVPPNPGITLYPSFLVPSNLQPPFGVVHIPPESTRAVQSAPLLLRNATHYLQATERVRVTLYGLTNAEASDWFDTVLRYSLDTSVFGLTNEPTAIRDEKSGQTELNVIAMKKTLEFEVIYNQHDVRDMALQLIKQARAVVLPQELVAA